MQRRQFLQRQFLKWLALEPLLSTDIMANMVRAHFIVRVNFEELLSADWAGCVQVLELQWVDITPMATPKVTATLTRVGRWSHAIGVAQGKIRGYTVSYLPLPSYRFHPLRPAGLILYRGYVYMQRTTTHGGSSLPLCREGERLNLVTRTELLGLSPSHQILAGVKCLVSTQLRPCDF